MFGYKKRKPFLVHCAVCDREFSIKFNPEEVKKYNYPFREGAGVVFTLECDFCGTYGKILQYPSGEVETIDHTWGKKEKEHKDKMDAARGELLGIKAQLENAPENRDLIAKRTEVEKVIQKLESNFKKELHKYNEFKTGSRERWRETLKNMD